MEKKTKDFDCVEMMHKGALRIHNTLKGMTREEQLAYWRQRHIETLKALGRYHEASPKEK